MLRNVWVNERKLWGLHMWIHRTWKATVTSNEETV